MILYVYVSEKAFFNLKFNGMKLYKILYQKIAATIFIKFCKSQKNFFVRIVKNIKTKKEATIRHIMSNVVLAANSSILNKRQFAMQGGRQSAKEVFKNIFGTEWFYFWYKNFSFTHSQKDKLFGFVLGWLSLFGAIWLEHFLDKWGVWK